MGISFVYRDEGEIISTTIYEGIAFGIVSAHYLGIVIKDMPKRIDSLLDKIGEN